MIGMIKMELLQELFECRDIMEKCKYPVEMINGISQNIDKAFKEN